MVCLLSVNCQSSISGVTSPMSTVPDGNHELILLLYASIACCEMTAFKERGAIINILVVCPRGGGFHTKTLGMRLFNVCVCVARVRERDLIS